MKISGIEKKHHVYADLSYVSLVLASPAMAGFKDNDQATALCQVFAYSALSYTLCTKARWGVLKWIPYRAHVGLDLAAGLAALAVSTIPRVRKDKAARLTFIAMGLTGLIVGTLSLIGSAKKNHLSIHLNNINP